MIFTCKRNFFFIELDVSDILPAILYTGYTQKNGAVSKVNKFFSQPKRAQRTMRGGSFLNRARNSSCTVITDLDTSKRSTQKAFSCCDAILETGLTVSMTSELLVAHEKLGHFPLLTVYVLSV